jgi:N-acetylgalactosamine kinase
MSNPSITDEAVVVILAAGKGTRMGREDVAKVCFEIDGVPAINRLIEAFKKQRFGKFLVIVGSMAEQVMQTVAVEHPEVLFVYQAEQLGTGHAARVAAQSLQQMNHRGPVLLTLGDKYLEPEAVELLVDGFIKQQADLALLTIPRTAENSDSSGRVFIDKAGQVRAILEQIDIARQGIADDLQKKLSQQKSISAAAIHTIAETHIPNLKKITKAIPQLMQLAKHNKTVEGQELKQVLRGTDFNLQIAGKNYTAVQIESHCRQFNPSLYLFQADTFYRGVAQIDNDNAQKEFYFTDIVKHINDLTDTKNNPLRIRAVPADSADCIQGFNSPDELLNIQDTLRRKKKKVRSATPGIVCCRLKSLQYTTVGTWLERIENNTPALRRWLQSIYGDHPDLHAEKRKEFIKVLKCYGKRFGFDDKVILVRAPGRINLMGRHVDHRGGYNNFLALHRETVAVASVREDDQVHAVSTNSKQFPAQQFSIGHLLGRFAFADWLNFINSDWVRSLLQSTAGAWGNYIQAALLRLQHRYADLKICGMNLALYGSVPMAAGLSSSSTLVVAALRAAIALNNLELDAQQFVDLCGEGEWFVGSRGGAGDHAAITLGQRGKIAQVGYFPFRVEQIVPAPDEYQVIIADSTIKAAKSTAAKEQFNARVTAYNLGLELLKQRSPEIAHALEHLRDLNTERLGCRTSDIYRYLLRVPEFMTRKEFKATLAREYQDLIVRNFSSHKDPGSYPVRGVLLYGVAECLRSGMALNFLKQGDVRQFGELMKISHDGDRVSQPDNSGTYRNFSVETSEAAINQLIADLASEDPERVRNAQLYMQPGTYACSTPEIDRMVDIACSVDGVVGAQIAGAGLGGCIMILAHKDAVSAVHRALTRHYYKPRNLTPAVIDCITTEGACLAEF